MTVLVMVAASLGVAMGNVSADQGSRDTYGYRWTDSNSPDPTVAFNWVEINSTGTNTGLTGSLNYVGPMPIGFTFNFYGNAYLTFYATTSGYVSFGSGSYSWSNDLIPDWSSPDNFIAPYWDYGTNYDGTIYYQTIGSAPNRQLVVEWENVSTMWASSLLTYELILNETGDIWFQYLDVGTDYGQDASVGIEDSSGDVGTQYSYETNSLSNGLAIRFSTGPVMISPSQTGRGMMGTTVSYTLTVKNWQASADSFEITFTSELGWAVALFDSLGNPLTDTDGDTLPDTGSMASGSSADIEVTVDIPASPSAYQDITNVTATSRADSSANDTCTLTTDVASAWFTPPHEDLGLDPNGDGDFDVLSVNASINVRVDGWYYIYAYLHLPSETQISFDSAGSYYTAGTYTMNLRFFGWNIFDYSTNGPYHVHMTLYDGVWWDIQDTDIHTTAAYSYTEFMTRPGVLGTTHGDGAVDSDSDGLFDSLFIYATVIANYDWSFRVDVYLYDSSYNYIASAQNYTSLVAGTRVVSTEFDAWDIVELGQDGFFYADIYLYALVDGAYVYMGWDSHTTGDYTLSQFERRPIFFSSPINDYANDTDSDGYYDFLEISATVDVAIEGDYSIKGILRADSWRPVIDTVTVTTHLTVGLHTIDLYFPGWPIYENGDSDDMDVTLEAWSGSTLVDTELYTTPTYYYYYDFETSIGWFEPPYNEYGLDINSDTLYDYLVAEIPVTIDTAGYYEVTAELYRWGTVEILSNTSYLAVGTTTVEIRFTGWLVFNWGYNGPFTINLDLYDDYGRWMDSDSFTTAAYLYDEFQTLPAQFGTPNEAYVDDADSDGDYDALFVNATVDVAVAGKFLVDGVLYDPSWNYIVSGGLWVNLGVGSHVVQFSFPAWAVNTHGADGIFHIQLQLSDTGRHVLDGVSISTSAYQNETFDLTVPRIVSAWADAAPAMDGSMTAGEWADATSVSLAAADTRNLVYGTMLVMNDETNLYIAYDAFGDTHEDSNDWGAIGFDTGNDGVRTDGHEDAFLLSGWNPTNGQHFAYSSSSTTWSTHCYPFDTADPDHGTLAGRAGFGSSDGHAMDHRIYEFSIPLALLDTAMGDVIGFLGGNWGYDGLYDSWNGTDSWWPVWYASAPGLAKYGEIALAEAAVIIPPPVTTASVSGTGGSMGWYKSQANVTLSATGGDGGVDHTEYRLDGGSWTTYSAMIQITAQGTHTLEYRSVDNAAQVETTKTLTVKIDTVAPTSAPAVSGSWFWLNATDATSGIGSIKYRIDGGAWTTYTGKVNITDSGTHVVEYYAVDAAGNNETLKSVTVKVEKHGGSTGISSGTLMLIGLVVAAIVAALLVLVLLMRRRKGQAPMTYPPVQAEMQPPGPPQ